MEQRYKTFTGLILNIYRCIQKIKNSEMGNFGFKGKQVQCLFSLYNLEDGASSTELCEMCDEDKGAMSRTIKELSEQDMVFIDKKEEQKYRNPIKLTEKGKKFGKVIADKISNILSQVSNGISDDHRENFYSTLTLISKNLTTLCECYEE